MKKQVAGIVAVLLATGLASAQDYKSRLAEEPSISGIREFCSRFQAFGKVHDAEYKTQGAHLFMCWSNPDGSKVSTFLFGYVERQGKWRLLVDHPEDSTVVGSNVIVSMTDETVRIVNAAGETLRTYSLREAGEQR